METKNLNTKNCVGLGEILFDVLPSGSQLGGAPANFAYHAGQHGLHSVAVSAVGKELRNGGGDTCCHPHRTRIQTDVLGSGIPDW